MSGSGSTAGTSGSSAAAWSAGLSLRGMTSPALAAANSLNSLARTTGSSLASALGGTILAAFTVSLGGVALPSLTAYRVLFAICAGAAALGAAVGLGITKPERRQQAG